MNLSKVITDFFKKASFNVWCSVWLIPQKENSTGIRTGTKTVFFFFQKSRWDGWSFILIIITNKQQPSNCYKIYNFGVYAPKSRILKAAIRLLEFFKWYKAMGSMLVKIAIIISKTRNIQLESTKNPKIPRTPFY